MLGHGSASSSAPDRGGCQGLVQIREDIVDVLDADAEADAARADAGRQLLGGRHLPMRGRGRMAGQGFRIAQIDQPFEELQRVVEPQPAVQSAANIERQQRASAATEIFLHQRVIRTVGEAGIVHRRDARSSRRNSATLRAFSTWRSTRSATVSIPCSSRKAFIGASTAPMVR